MGVGCGHWGARTRVAAAAIDHTGLLNSPIDLNSAWAGMANFNTHFNVAFAASGVMGLVFYKAGMLSGSTFLGCVAMGTVGGLLPDIDSDHSTPVRVGFVVLSMAVAFALVVWLVAQLSLLALIGVWVLTFVTMRHGVLALYSHLTVHRGMVHSVPYMALLALLVVWGSHHGFGTSAQTSWFLGAFTWFGALVHLVLDELYSVNLLGMKLKKSSGTALKFFRWEQRHRYVTLYAVVAFLCWWGPPAGAFWATLNDPLGWLLLKQALLPSALGL